MAAILTSCIASAAPGTLGLTFEPQAFLGKTAAGPQTVTLRVSSSSRGLTGCRVVPLQATCNSVLGRRRLSDRQDSSHVTCVAVTEDVSLEEEETAPMEEISTPSPSSFEVHQLLMELCDETSIAELQLKVGSFRLNVKRNVGKMKNAAVAPQVAPPPVPSKPMVDSMPAASSTPASPKAAPKTSSPSGLIASLSKPLSSTWALLESAADEGLLFVKSPKVGYFRKGRVAKGKSGPPLVEEGQVIKEGHVVCYLEQLGTQQPVESSISGEVVKVLWDDGEPVGYGDPLIAIRPSFPGIKKLT